MLMKELAFLIILNYLSKFLFPNSDDFGRFPIILDNQTSAHGTQTFRRKDRFCNSDNTVRKAVLFGCLRLVQGVLQTALPLEKTGDKTFLRKGLKTY